LILGLFIEYLRIFIDFQGSRALGFKVFLAIASQKKQFLSLSLVLLIFYSLKIEEHA